MKNSSPVLVLLGLLTVLQTAPALAQESDFGELLDDCQRIVFLGDSITYSGGYVAWFDAWLETSERENKPEVLNLGLPSETVSGLSEKGHAGGKFPRPDLAERLDRVLEKTSPDLVIACYGINCGIYQPYDEARFEKYKTGIQHLVDKVGLAGAELVLLTPPIYDGQQSKLEFSYNPVMKRYAKWLMEQRDTRGWKVIDVHSAMSRELESQRVSVPFHTFQPDAVHPNRQGHLVIARTLIRGFDKDLFFVPRTDAGARLAYSSVKQRLDVLRDAWLTHTGHKRPGLEKGLTLEEAKSMSATHSQSIRLNLNRSARQGR